MGAVGRGDQVGQQRLACSALSRAPRAAASAVAAPHRAGGQRRGPFLQPRRCRETS
jgi:hypothetical protein